MTEQQPGPQQPQAGAEVPPGASDAAPSAAEADAVESAAAGAEVPQPDGGGAEVPVPDDTPDFQDLYLRARAEMDNVRKRARRDVEAAQARGVGRFAKELLPALDDLERAIAAAEAAGEGETVLSGIRLVHRQLLDAMSRVGIKAQSPDGETFDPHQHEAVAQTPVEGVASGTIVQVYQAGYTLGEDVLRAAKVVVAA